MRILTLLNSLLILFFSASLLASPPNPLNCFCEFEAVLPAEIGPVSVEPTDCQITEETTQARIRGDRGAFMETLSWVGGAGQACATLMVEKFKDGNDNNFRCTIWIEQSQSDETADCSVVTPRNRPVNDFVISRRGMRACQRLLDEVADEVFALPDCRAP